MSQPIAKTIDDLWDIHELIYLKYFPNLSNEKVSNELMNLAGNLEDLIKDLEEESEENK